MFFYVCFVKYSFRRLTRAFCLGARGRPNVGIQALLPTSQLSPFFTPFSISNDVCPLIVITHSHPRVSHPQILKIDAVCRVCLLLIDIFAFLLFVFYLFNFCFVDNL